MEAAAFKSQRASSTASAKRAALRQPQVTEKRVGT